MEVAGRGYERKYIMYYCLTCVREKVANGDIYSLFPFALIEKWQLFYREKGRFCGKI